MTNDEKKEQQEQKFLKMTTAPIHKLIPAMAVPTIASMLVTSLYNMADTYFVSQISTSASGAVGIVFSLMALMQAVAFTFAVGASSTAARALGAKNYDLADQAASTSFFTSFACGLLITILGEIFLSPLVNLLGATPTIRPYAMDYARYILLGAPFIISSFTLNQALRAEGDAVLAMVGITAGGVLNIALDPLFIYVLDMGTAGAAIATIISQFISFSLLLSWFVLHKSVIRVRLSAFSPTARMYKEIFRIGSPSFFRQGLNSIASMLLNHIAGGFGDAAVAAMSIVMRVIQFIVSILLGYGQGFQPVCGYNYGAKKYARVKSAFYFCVITGCIGMGLLGLVGFILAPRIMTIFRKEDMEVIAIGTRALRLQCLTLPLNAWIIMSNMLFQSSGKAIRAAFLALARQGLCLMPMLLILPRMFGIPGLQSAQPSADLLTFLIAIPITIAMLRELTRDQKALDASAAQGGEADN